MQVDCAGIGSVISNIFTIAIYIYMIPAVMVFAPYYNWKYAQENGFVSWILLGEIVPTMQAAIWPYYIVKHFTGPARPTQSWTAEEIANSKHLLAAFASDNEAIRIGSAGGPGPIPQEELRRIVALDQTALMEASLVEDAVLDKIHPELKQHFRNELIPAIQLKVKNWQTPETSLSMQKEIHELEEKWANWFNANKDDLYIPKSP